MPGYRSGLSLSTKQFRLKQRLDLNQSVENSFCPSTGTLTPEIQPPSPPNFQDKANRVGSATIIGNYILQNKIEGSSVYKAIHKETRQEYACKIISVENHPKFLLSHFRLDSHEHINSITEVIIGEKQTYIFFPKSYGDLHAYVRNKRKLKEPDAQKLFSQVASCVKYCHDNGVILRDLKLRKFVFSDPERTTLKLETLDDAVLLDETDDDWLTDKHGCPAYVSPELLIPSGRYSGRAADCWSLGVILYTMLVGRYPFHDSDPAILFTKIRSGRFVVPESISSHAWCLLRSLLRLDPHERLTADDVLSHPWLTNPISSGRHGDGGRARHYDNKFSNSDQMVPDCAITDESSSMFM